MAVAARFEGAQRFAGACAAALLAAWAAGAGSAQASELLNVRLGYHADKTRVVFDLDAASNYRIARQSNSELVLEFDARASDEAIPGNGKPLRWVTIEGVGAGRSRVRMTLAGPVKLKTQVLRRPDRVVLDLLPPTATAPPPPAPAPAPAPKLEEAPAPEFTADSAEDLDPVEAPPLAPDSEASAPGDGGPLFGGGLLRVAVGVLLIALAVGVGLALRRRGAAPGSGDDGWGPPPRAPVPMGGPAPRRAPAPPVVGIPAASAAKRGLDEQSERRIARLEKRLEAMLDSKERLETQLANQAEEQRVLRAALARIQHTLRERGRPGGGDSGGGGKS